MALKELGTFPSLYNFQEQLKLFQAETFTQFTLQSAGKLAGSYNLYPQFKCSVLRYVCKQVQRVHQKDGTKRPKQK